MFGFCSVCGGVKIQHSILGDLEMFTKLFNLDLNIETQASIQLANGRFIPRFSELQNSDLNFSNRSNRCRDASQISE